MPPDDDTKPQRPDGRNEVGCFQHSKQLDLEHRSKSGAKHRYPQYHGKDAQAAPLTAQYQSDTKQSQTCKNALDRTERRKNHIGDSLEDDGQDLALSIWSLCVGVHHLSGKTPARRPAPITPMKMLAKPETVYIVTNLGL